MRVRVRVHPGAKLARLRVEAERLEVYVRARAHEGAATREALATIAAALNVAPARVTCVQGEHSRLKLVEVTAPDAEQRLRRLLAGDD